MKFSYNWLTELSGTKKSPEELAELLLTHSFEVEEVRPYEHGLSGVVVGEVVAIAPHPNADRLRVAQVSTGEESRQIVCGAPNIAVGQKVAVVMPGTKLQNGMEIEAAEIRGASSLGMIASEEELGIGQGKEGIVVLPPDSPVGSPLATLLGLDDVIVDVKILPNRGRDALSHFGLAREISALEGRILDLPFPQERFSSEQGVRDAFTLSVEAKSACLFYAGLLFDLSTEKKSISLEMKGRMLMLGHHSLFPAVDLAQYYSLLYGQPMHVFDADKISGRSLSVRFAHPGEVLTVLSGHEITLSGEDIVIADSKGPIALAGISGGKESAVSEETKSVWVEMANFDPAVIRRSRVRHGLPTAAAYLFEHGVDPIWPAILPSSLIPSFEKTLGAQYKGGVRYQGSEEKEKRVIHFSFDRIESTLGIVIPKEKVISLLRGLSIGVEMSGEEMTLSIPSFRSDLLDEVDIIEEIGRVYGYEHISPSIPLVPLLLSEENKEEQMSRVALSECAALGFDEIMTYSFYGKEEREESGVPLDEHLRLRNPMNPDQAYMRAKLLPMLFRKMRENMYRSESLRLVERGKVFFREGAAPREEDHLALALSEKESDASEIFFRLKGMAEHLLEVLRIDTEIAFVHAKSAPSFFHPGKTAQVVVEGKVIGIIGEAHPDCMKKFGARKMAGAEFSLDAIRDLSLRPRSMRPLPKFPFVTRDISLRVPEAVTVASLEEVIRRAGPPLLKECVFFDVYEKGREKNISFRLAFGAADRTIEKTESDHAFEHIVEEAESVLGAQLSL